MTDLNSIDLLPVRSIQNELQSKIAEKFAEPQRWLWTPHLLQLTSDEQTAAYTASLYPGGVEVLDIGCGGGSDAVALARRGSVIAVDRDPLAAAICWHNLQNNVLSAGRPWQVECREAETIDVAGAWLHLDPDRRSDAGRSTQMKFHSPSEEIILRWIANSAGGSIKLAPGCRDEPPVGVPISRQWISRGGSVVQQRWWWNTPTLADSPRSVAVIRVGGVETYIPHRDRLADAQRQLYSRIRSEAPRPGEWIGDVDGAFRAAELQPVLATDVDAGLLGNDQGFFVCEHPMPSPWIRWRQVAAVCSLDVKKIGVQLRQLASEGEPIEAIDLKTRNVRSVPEKLLRLAGRPGARRAAVYATTVGRRHVAIICDPTEASI